jgi:starvation-inducible outer membrane lipoprotein
MLIRTLLIAITFIWLGAGMVGCVTNPQVLKEQKSEEARAAIETVDRQADAILAQAKKDLAVAKVLLKKDEHASDDCSVYAVHLRCRRYCQTTCRP